MYNSSVSNSDLQVQGFTSPETKKSGFWSSLCGSKSSDTPRVTQSEPMRQQRGVCYKLWHSNNLCYKLVRVIGLFSIGVGLSYAKELLPGFGSGGNLVVQPDGVSPGGVGFDIDGPRRLQNYDPGDTKTPNNSNITDSSNGDPFLEFSVQVDFTEGLGETFGDMTEQMNTLNELLPRMFGRFDVLARNMSRIVAGLGDMGEQGALVAERLGESFISQMTSTQQDLQTLMSGTEPLLGNLSTVLVEVSDVTNMTAVIQGFVRMGNLLQTAVEMQRGMHNLLLTANGTLSDLSNLQGVVDNELLPEVSHALVTGQQVMGQLESSVSMITTILMSIYAVVGDGQIFTDMEQGLVSYNNLTVRLISFVDSMTRTVSESITDDSQYFVDETAMMWGGLLFVVLASLVLHCIIFLECCTYRDRPQEALDSCQRHFCGNENDGPPPEGFIPRFRGLQDNYRELVGNMKNGNLTKQVTGKFKSDSQHLSLGDSQKNTLLTSNKSKNDKRHFGGVQYQSVLTDNHGHNSKFSSHKLSQFQPTISDDILDDTFDDRKENDRISGNPSWIEMPSRSRNHLAPSNQISVSPRMLTNYKGVNISMTYGDITNSHTNCVINPSNGWLCSSGDKGVSGSFYLKEGGEYSIRCHSIVNREHGKQPFPTGEVVRTSGKFKGEYKHIIHAVTTASNLNCGKNITSYDRIKQITFDTLREIDSYNGGLNNKSPIKTVTFPLLASGENGGDIKTSAQAIADGIKVYLKSVDGKTQITEIAINGYLQKNLIHIQNAVQG